MIAVVVAVVVVNVADFDFDHDHDHGILLPCHIENCWGVKVQVKWLRAITVSNRC
jgi:hypothetical protein